jgi:hypothetical protein
MLDRQIWKFPFRVIEVMNVNQINPDSRLVGVSGSFDAAGQGTVGIGRLARWVDLYQVEQAEAAPKGCLSTGLRAKITFCRANTGWLAS